jgi:aspartyl-tRNA(Asn)/glutamyl-tRNA(Gln) amidotransferase subunit A
MSSKGNLGKEIEKINKEFSYFNFLESGDNLTRIIPKAKFLVSVKDSICVKDMPTTGGSKILDGYLPRFDATVVERLKKAGGVVIGKTAMDAFGFGSFCVNVGLDKKIPLNPLDKKRSCGGSSGGPAGFTRALPGNIKHIALGESTGGSIACPASFCGVVGLTPTYGRVSRYGQIDYGSSLDKIGPMAKTVGDCAKALEIISGYDGKDSTCIDKPLDFVKILGKDCKGMKIGLIKEGFGKGVDKEISRVVKNAVEQLRLNAGVEVEEVSLPLTMEHGVGTYYLLSMTEASTNLAKLCGLRYGQEEDVTGKGFDEYFTSIRSKNFNSETKRRIILGTFARMAGFRDAYYVKAAKIRTLIIKEYKKLFKKYDVLISPSMPIVAPTFKEIEKLTPLQHYMMDILTVGPNLAGMPHLTVPCGVKDGMPIGMLLIGDHWQEKKIIQLGDCHEKISGGKDE